MVLITRPDHEVRNSFEVRYLLTGSHLWKGFFSLLRSQGQTESILLVVKSFSEQLAFIMAEYYEIFAHERSQTVEARVIVTYGPSF